MVVRVLTGGAGHKATTKGLTSIHLNHALATVGESKKNPPRSPVPGTAVKAVIRELRGSGVLEWRRNGDTRSACVQGFRMEIGKGETQQPYISNYQ
jgi:hypothetical protein